MKAISDFKEAIEESTFPYLIEIVKKVGDYADFMKNVLGRFEKN